MIARTELSFLLQLSNNHAKGITASRNLVVSRVREVSRVSGISVSLCWLAYLAAMHMESYFPQAWLAHSPRETNQITGGSYPLRWLNLENYESELCIYGVILRIPPLYCKYFDDRYILSIYLFIYLFIYLMCLRLVQS